MSYEATIASAGGNDDVMAKSLVIACERAALTYFSKLEPNSIFSWEHLKAKLLSNFQGFSRAFLTSVDLFSCKQEDKEPLTSYFRRFVQLKAQLEDLPEYVVINAFIRGYMLRQVYLRIELQTLCSLPSTSLKLSKNY